MMDTCLRALDVAGQDALLSVFVSAEFVGVDVLVFVGVGEEAGVFVLCFMYFVFVAFE